MNTRARLIVIVSVTLVTAACRQIVGIEESATPGGDVVSCGSVSFGGAECTDCVVTSCCTEAAACTGNARCRDLSSCSMACAPDDEVCAATCRSRFPDAYGSEAAAFASCRAARCSTACAIRCGGYAYPNAPCATCAEDHCCDLAAACMADAACASLVACERACAPRDDVCLHACELARPGGVLGARAFGACVQSSCAKSCIGLSWSCLVRPARPPPPPVGGNARITYRFIDYETEAPIAGLVVRACNKMDVDCKNPLYESSTLADGIAVLRVPLGGSEIYAEVRGKTYGPILVFLPRLVGDYVAGTIPIATHATFLKLAAPIAIPNPSLGTVLASVVDCAGARAAGVTLAADPSHGSTRFYTRGRLPAATSTATDDDGFGAGGFVNVEAYTSISIQASVVENGLSFPRVEVVARPGAGYTHVEIRAAPP